MEFDFATIPQSLESMDGVPKEFHGLYRPKENGEGFDLWSPAKLQNSLAQARRERDEAKDERDTLKSKAGALGAWQALGKDPDAVKQAMEAAEASKAEALARKDAEIEELKKGDKSKVTQAEFDALKAERDTILSERDTIKATTAKTIDDLNAAHAAEIGERDKKLFESDAVFTKSIAERDLLAAMARRGAIPNRIAHELLPQVAGVREGDKILTRVMQEDGKTPRVKGDGSSFTEDDLVEQYEKDPEWQFAFLAKGTSGTGAQGNRGNGVAGKTMSRSEFETRSGAEKHKLMSEGVTLTD